MAYRTDVYHHNTPAEVRAYLQGALEIVDELEPPEDLRVPLFVQAATLLAGKQVFYEQVGLNGPAMHIPRG